MSLSHKFLIKELVRENMKAWIVVAVTTNCYFSDRML